MDPLNWAHRFYLIESIHKCGFGDGWPPIIDCVNQLSQIFLGIPFKVTEIQCHTFYLQILAEFGDFRRYDDPLTYPAPGVREKIHEMRCSQLRTELIKLNNQIRYNNIIIKENNDVPMYDPTRMRWIRFPKEPSSMPNPNPLVLITSRVKSAGWFRMLPESTTGEYGKVHMSIDIIIQRCVTGKNENAMDLLRDLVHLTTNWTIGTNLSENEKRAIKEMMKYFTSELRMYLINDPRWDSVRRHLGSH